ncbi:tripartite motif containing 108 [Osmerus eperlanus]|uniref:tripartite motif containing 108 n=1 Tax=Osmerus eperlanus TaxID=29151 RepID=UPI002E1077C2
MASASYRAELTCSVCQDIFTDPVSLTCGHSFCRECVTGSPGQRACPCCQAVYAANLTTNLTLKKLADTAKEDKNKASSWMCAEHEEKLKLFCETDQQLVCVICRDGEEHNGHKFKPIKEAAQMRKQGLEDTMQLLIGKKRTTEDLIKTQEGEKTKLKQKTQQLKVQISCQFDEMQQFLKRRQKEIQEELEQKNKEALKEMEVNLERLKTHLSEGRERENWMRSEGEVSEPEAFLKGWTEKMTEQPSRAAKMTLVPGSLSFSPYSSHLQFLVWKEMLRCPTDSSWHQEIQI